MSEQLPIHVIRTDGGTQARASIDADVVADYAAAIAAGVELPPIVVFHDGAEHWPGDGHHRISAHRSAGRATIAADVRPGSRRDAILHAAGANAAHGLRRTHEDKRRAVRLLLDDAEWAGWSDREIARRTGTDNTFVSKLRRQTAEGGVKPHPRAKGRKPVLAPAIAVARLTLEGPAPPLTAELLREFQAMSARVEAARDAVYKTPECPGCGRIKVRCGTWPYFPVLCKRCFVRDLPAHLQRALGELSGARYIAALAEALELLGVRRTPRRAAIGQKG